MESKVAGVSMKSRRKMISANILNSETREFLYYINKINTYSLEKIFKLLKVQRKNNYFVTQIEH